MRAQPRLFTQASSTLLANLEGVATRFRQNRITLPEYLRAAMRQPSLFGLTAETVARNAVAITERFHIFYVV